MNTMNADERMRKNIIEMTIKEMKDKAIRNALNKYGVEKAAKVLGVSARSLYLWKKSNKL